MIAEYTSLKIVRILKYAWLYYPNASEKCFAISKGYMTYDENDNKILIVEDGRSHRPKVLLNNVTLHDLYMGESEISFTNVEQLFNTLTLKGNPLFVNVIQTGSGGSQDIDQTLANGPVATDKMFTLQQTPDDSYDILKTVLYPYGIDIYSKVAGELQTIILGIRGADLSWTDGAATCGIIPRRTGGGIGNIVNGVFSLPEQFATEELEILASRQWANAQIYTAKTEAEAYADGLFNTLVGASPTDLDTIQEISAALQNNPDVIAEIITALGNRLRFDINNQGLSSTEKANALANLGIIVADLLNRSNHTGTQAISTISGLQTYLNKINSGIVSSAEKPLVNTTSAQAIYDTDLNAEANCAYEIFGSADFTGLAAVSSFLSFSLLGTATIDSFSVTVLANKAANNSNLSISTVQSNNTQITSPSAVSTARLIFFGTVRVSGAGTVKPSVAFSSATASMKVSANAKFSFNKIGSNTVTNY